MSGLSLTEREARIDFAVGLYADGKVSLGKAAEVGGIHQQELQHELSRRRIPLNFSVDDLREDVATLDRLFARDRRQ